MTEYVKQKEAELNARFERLQQGYKARSARLKARPLTEAELAALSAEMDKAEAESAAVLHEAKMLFIRTAGL
jgi:hypothetical protein